MSVSAQDKIVADFEKKLFDSALGTDHAFRQLNRLINFDEIAATLQKTYSHLGQPWYSSSPGTQGNASAVLGRLLR